MVSKKYAVCIVAMTLCVAVAGPIDAGGTDRVGPPSEVKLPNDGTPGPATRDTGGPDPYGYAWIDSDEPGGPTYSWVDISGSGASVFLSDDETAGPFAVGFGFDFYGTVFNNFWLSSNGWVSFVAPSSSFLTNDCPMPTNSTPYNLLALMWDDLDPGDNNDPIYYQSFTAGSCPYGSYAGACAVIQYEDFCHFPGGATCDTAGTFEIILFDNAEILYQFEDSGVELGGGSTTGIQNADATIGLTYGCDGTYLADNLAVLFFLPPQGDLAVTADAPAGFAENGPFTFEITVDNYGPENQTNVAAADTLPAELSYISDDCGGSYTAPNWTWNIGGLVNGASASCTMTVEFAGGSCVPASNTITVSGDAFDPQGNNSAVVTNAFEAVDDGGFEGGTPNASWAEASTNFGTPLCDIPSCGTGTGTGPYNGDWWCWFGGISGVAETGSVTQTVTIDEGASDMVFWLEAIVCDSVADYMEATIDGNVVYTIDGSSPLCGQLGYTQQVVDISAFADGAPHTLEFYSQTFSNNGGGTNFFIDDVSIAGADCTTAQQPQAAIPTLNSVGIALLIGLIVGAGVVALRKMI